MAGDLFSGLDRQWVQQAKACGYVSMDALNDALGDEEATSEQIEELLAALSDAGVEVTEDGEPPQDGPSPALSELLASFAEYQRTGDRGPAEAALAAFRARFGPGFEVELPEVDG